MNYSTAIWQHVNLNIHTHTHMEYNTQEIMITEFYKCKKNKLVATKCNVQYLNGEFCVLAQKLRKNIDPKCCANLTVVFFLLVCLLLVGSVSWSRVYVSRLSHPKYTVQQQYHLGTCALRSSKITPRQQLFKICRICVICVCFFSLSSRRAIFFCRSFVRSSVNEFVTYAHLLCATLAFEYASNQRYQFIGIKWMFYRNRLMRHKQFKSHILVDFFPRF